MKKPKPRKPKPARMTADEKEQTRIRRKVGHDFALATDTHGRTMQAKGTAESRRRYTESGGGIIRVRAADPLAGITALSKQQKAAGASYRSDYEFVAREGLKTPGLKEHVDGGRNGSSIPAELLDASRRLAEARTALAHIAIVTAVDQVVGEGRSVRDAARETGEDREVVARLLKIGLDLLAAMNRRSKRAAIS